jgi:hypothetical protein
MQCREKAVVARSPLLKLALSTLHKSSFTAMPSDKDGGFVLVKRTELRKTMMGACKSEWYERAPFSVTTDAGSTTERSAYFNLVKSIGHTTDDKQLVQKLSQRRGKRFSTMSCTIKSHKCPGSVVPRLIHQSTNHHLEPLARWIVSVVRPKLRTFKHLCKNTTELLNQLSLIDFDHNCMFVKADVKDFYMSGDPVTLSQHVASMAPPHLYNVIQSATLRCLFYQYVMLSAHPGEGEEGEDGDACFRVKQGSGMGFQFSGEIADIAFIVSME